MTKKIPSANDLALFRQVIGNVRPIRSDKFEHHDRDRPKPIPKSSPIDIEEPMSRYPDADPEPVGREESMAYAAPGLQKNILKKLRKGHYGLDAEIDLHGLNGHEAKRELLTFLQHAVESGYQVIHVVHGKGYRSNDHYPILKNHLNLWLRQHKNVLAFCSAPNKDGGAGALFVLLQIRSNLQR